jgi:hypothetical protein
MSQAPAHAAIDRRPRYPKLCLLHTSEGSDAGTDEHVVSRWLDLAINGRERNGRIVHICTHILIRQNGTILRFIPPIHFQTWHSGGKSRDTNENWNQIAVGIDLNIAIGSHNERGHDGAMMPAPMIAALRRLLGTVELCRLPVIGHGTHQHPSTTNGRHDPGLDFDWANNVGLDRSIILPDFWSRDREVRMADIDAKAISLQNRQSTYSISDICVDAAPAFVGHDLALLA